MSEKKPGFIGSLKHIVEDQCHYDSDALPEDKQGNIFIKSEKKKPISSNFGRPRKHPYKPGKYKCSYCETLCSKPSVLTKHMRAHTNERPFPCGVCDRSFKTKSNLSKHEKSKSHSSKLGENHIITESFQSKREKVDLILQTLSGFPINSLNVPKSPAIIEFDSISKKAPVTEIEQSSLVSSEEQSDISDEVSILDNIKKEKCVEEIPENIVNVPEPTAESNSCSGVLTINSQEGPITVEVQINLNTMRHLQQGISNISGKKFNPSLPSISSRNDAELRAAESILHMANQGPKEDSFQKEDTKKNGMAPRKPPGTLSPLNRKSPEDGSIFKLISNSISKPSPSKDSESSKSTPLDEHDPLNTKIQTKSLVKENLLKKMKKKQGLKTNNISPVSDLRQSDSNHTSFNVLQNNFFPNQSLFKLNKNDTTVLKTLISDSKSPGVMPLKSSKGKAGIVIPKTQLLNSNSTILNCIPTTCNSPTFVLYTPPNNGTKPPVVSDAKHISTPGFGSFSESCKMNLPVKITNFNIDTAILSKVITNTQSLHQHQGNQGLNPDNLSITTSFPTSRVTIPSTCIDSKSEIQIEDSTSKDLTECNDTPAQDHQMADVDEQTPKIPYQHQLSNQATQESENDSSPRLCIVEESVVTEIFDKKASESDEEIDVVNTDSDDERLPLTRRPEIIYNEKPSKRSRMSCDEDSESGLKDPKRIKDMEKCVPLHAPNINAKDLMQDCPLNLSANRQPTIPPVSQISVSVLQNLYQTISPSCVSISSPTNSGTDPSSDSGISSLTNHNPAHPQSFQNFPSSSSSFSSNGHHLDYPIFENKMCCDVCSQIIEPSMVSLHKNMHIYTNSKDSHPNNTGGTKSGSSVSSLNSSYSSSSKISFNKPRTYKCVVCDIGFRVIGHLRKHHKSKTHLQGLVNSGLLSKALFSKIEQSKVPIQEVIDQKTGNIIPDVLSRYISNWSQPNAADCES